jgi:TRAP-type C4-dicarboxylate transport system substrate-binding protein
MSSTKIHFVGYHPKTSVQSRAMSVLSDALQRELGDNVAFHFDSDIGDLGHKANDLLRMVEAGDFDGCYFYSSYLTKRVPELGLFELPFEIGDRERFYALLDGALGQRVADSVAANTGYRALAYWDNGIRHLSNRVHPIHTPDDCKGLKIRTAFNEFHQAAFRAMGFEPMAIDVKDLPGAVADGTVDAQENPLTNMINYRVQAYHPYITLTSHLFGVSAVLVNAAKYEAWPERVQKGFAVALKEATAAQRSFAVQDDVTCMKTLKDDGAEIVTLSEAERAQFAEAVADVVAAEKQRFDGELLGLFEAS